MQGNIQIKTKLQHSLHPLSLWSRFGGNSTNFFKLYERYLWQPLFRNWVNGGIEERSLGIDTVAN